MFLIHLSSFSEFNTCFTCARVVDDSQSSKKIGNYTSKKEWEFMDKKHESKYNNNWWNKYCSYLRLKGIFMYFSIEYSTNLSRNLSSLNRWIFNGKEMFLMAVKINNNNNVWMVKIAHMNTLLLEGMKFIWFLIYWIKTYCSYCVVLDRIICKGGFQVFLTLWYKCFQTRQYHAWC